MNNNKKLRSTYRGSEHTYREVASQIAEKYGPDEVTKYDPYKNCLTFSQWNKAGFRVKQGEKALHSQTIVEKYDNESNVIAKYPKRINLFYIKQVEPIGKTA